MCREAGVAAAAGRLLAQAQPAGCGTARGAPRAPPPPAAALFPCPLSIRSTLLAAQVLPINDHTAEVKLKIVAQHLSAQPAPNKAKRRSCRSSFHIRHPSRTMAPLALSPMPAAYIAREAPLFLRQNDASTSCYTTTITQTRVQTLSRPVSPVVAQPSGTGSGAFQTTTTTEVLFETLLSTVLQTQTFTVTLPAPLSTSTSAAAAAASTSSLISPAPTNAATDTTFAPDSASAFPSASASEPAVTSTEASTTAGSAPTASSSASASLSYGRRGSLAHPNSAQITTLWATPLLLFLILLAWGMKGVRGVLYPWKM